MTDREGDAQDRAGTGAPDLGLPDLGLPDLGLPDLGLVDSLVQLSFLIQEILSQAAVQHDLSVAQLRLLGVLRDREPGMQELARHLKLDKSSVTGLIDRAERRGLVRRTAHPQDGRAVRVAATAQGQELAARGTAEIARQVTGIVRALPDADRARLAELAGAVVRHATDSPGPHGGGDTGQL
jgi:DNA-binding MarR family transcriptional regulator